MGTPAALDYFLVIQELFLELILQFPRIVVADESAGTLRACRQSLSSKMKC